jgi:putative ABC transport system permease protein
MPLEAVQRTFAKEDTVSAVLLTPKDVNQTTEIAATLRQDYPALAVVTQDEMLTEAENVMRMPMLYMGIMSVTGFVVAVAVIMSTMVMAVMERTREFGTLRAIGGRRRLIVGMVFAEALLMALIGSLPSMGLVLLMSRWMNTTLPSVAQLLEIVGFTVGAAVLAASYPAWRAARVEPMEALRYE